MTDEEIQRVAARLDELERQLCPRDKLFRETQRPTMSAGAKFKRDIAAINRKFDKVQSSFDPVRKAIDSNFDNLRSTFEESFTSTEQLVSQRVGEMNQRMDTLSSALAAPPNHNAGST